MAEKRREAAQNSLTKVPAHIQPYVDVFGSEEEAVAFLLAFGGAAVHVAERPRATSLIVKHCGMEKARALGKRFGACYLQVPIPRKWIAESLHARGVSVLEIARRLHMTDKTIRKWLRPDIEQLDLFAE